LLRFGLKNRSVKSFYSQVFWSAECLWSEHGSRNIIKEDILGLDNRQDDLRFQAIPAADKRIQNKTNFSIFKSDL
jgi:hypothetical protein